MISNEKSKVSFKSNTTQHKDNEYENNSLKTCFS